MLQECAPIHTIRCGPKWNKDTPSPGKSQTASGRLFALELPTCEREIVFKYMNGMREAIDSCLRANLTLESVFLNICLDQMPVHVRGPLNDKLTRINKNFLFNIDTFETKFSSVMSLTSEAPEQNKTKRIVAYNMGDIKEIKKKEL